MDSEATIKVAIERKVGNVPYSLWNIGVTDNPTQSKQHHANEGKNTIFWKHWNTDAQTAANMASKSKNIWGYKKLNEWF